MPIVTQAHLFQIELDAILALNPDLVPAQPTENVRTLPSKLPAPVRPNYWQKIYSVNAKWITQYPCIPFGF